MPKVKQLISLVTFYIIGTSISSFICSIKDSIASTLPLVSAPLLACSLSFRSWQDSCPGSLEEHPVVIGTGFAVGAGLVLFPSVVAGWPSCWEGSSARCACYLHSKETTIEEILRGRLEIAKIAHVSKTTQIVHRVKGVAKIVHRSQIVQGRVG